MQLIDLLTALQRDKTRMPTAEEALPGRTEPVLPEGARHLVLGTPLHPPYPGGMRLLQVGMGCFWGAEKAFWTLEGVHVTAVGYGGGLTPNPTYEEVCSGRTGHNELVRIVYDPNVVSLPALLRVFWEGHDPTQGMRQGNDVGTQYRSGIYLSHADDREAVEASREAYAARLRESGHAEVITTEVVALDPAHFYFAEPVHQQYLAAHPGGYCGLGGLGVSLS